MRTAISEAHSAGSKFAGDIPLHLYATTNTAARLSRSQEMLLLRRIIAVTIGDGPSMSIPAMLHCPLRPLVMHVACGGFGTCSYHEHAWSPDKNVSGGQQSAAVLAKNAHSAGGSVSAPGARRASFWATSDTCNPRFLHGPFLVGDMGNAPFRTFFVPCRGPPSASFAFWMWHI